jgi:hypothetical protein
LSPPFAITTTAESASSAAKAREAASVFDPIITVTLFCIRNESMREAPLCGAGNPEGRAAFMVVEVKPGEPTSSAPEEDSQS